MKITKTIYFIAVIILLTFSCKEQSLETDSVRKTYEKYKDAILQDRGEEAVDYIDSRTLKYYAEVLEKVKTADKTTVDSLSFLDKFQILRIRLTAKQEEILSFNEKILMTFAINNGMVGKDDVLDQTLGEITVQGDFAKGQLIVKGKKTPFYMNFYKEKNQWKIDLTSLLPTTTIAYKKLIEESGLTENEYIFELLERVSNKNVEEEIWIPTEKLKSLKSSK